RLKRFQVEEKRRQVGQIELMIEEFSRMIADLEYEIAAEHRRTGIEDEKHFAYSTFARAARKRRDNLNTSIADLRSQLEAARAGLDLSERELAQEEERLDREASRDVGRVPAGHAAG
ncbi:MAG TPA: flagellar export protein FliJ, partial [Afifellaceae bacterium]|nr:flagellar export protein FliJ [Afifellaceae bacterium]